MIPVTLQIPESLDLPPAQFAQYVAVTLYEDRKLSLGHAAQLASLSKVDFVEVLGRYGVSLFNCPPEEVLADLANARDSNS